jgi:hypothetical protein
MTETAKTGLDLLREPFPPHQISKLPKPTKKQTDDVKADFKAGKRCQVCGAWHHPDVVHLDYVGHAALTHRLLDADPNWTWEPMACGPDGLPALDRNGGMWIRLTICGVTRIGYGSADGKSGGDAIKEVIGDALRNAGMRFGAALDLWHKGDLHGDADGDSDAGSQTQQPSQAKPASKADSRETYDRLSRANRALTSEADFNKFWAQADVQSAAKSMPADWQKTLKTEKDDKAAELAERAALADDDFPGDAPNNQKAA